MTYLELLKYSYNSLHASGKIVEVVEMIKSQKRREPFDFEGNSVEGINFFSEAIK